MIASTRFIKKLFFLFLFVSLPHLAVCENIELPNFPVLDDTERPYDVIGVGGCIMDIVVKVSQKTYKNLSGTLGGAQVVDEPTLSKMIKSVNSNPQLVPGGSCANTIKGLAKTGKKTAFFAKRGDDEIGTLLEKNLKDNNVDPLLAICSEPTGHLASFVNPQGKRTFFVCPGATLALTSKDFTSEVFKKGKIVHIEGYFLRNNDAIDACMKMAKEAGCLVSFDLGCFELVREHKEKILDLIKNYVDILIANKFEAKELTGKSPKEACREIQKIAKVAIVLTGKRGCWVGSQGKVVSSLGLPANVIDTTGAGDLYTSGFLYALLERKPLEECAYIGNIFGKSVIEHIGAEIPEDKWAPIFQELDRLKKKEKPLISQST